MTAWEVAAGVLDPELPVITIAELGVLRDVRVGRDGGVDVSITPTYSGCPAVDAIREDVDAALRAAGYAPVRVRTVLAPAWTTDWITPAGRARLRENGIAPPGPRGAGPVLVALAPPCPRCGSRRTRQVSRFGPTACVSTHTCTECREPFDHVKAI